MGGSNPYNAAVSYELPKKSYKLTVISEDGGEEQRYELTVDPAKIPYDHNGLNGSLLDAMLGHQVSIDHACGGVNACSTCHVYVESGAKSCNEANEDEEDMLDSARSLKPNSRLACQCVPNGREDVVVRIPGWNRNMAREDH